MSAQNNEIDAGMTESDAGMEKDDVVGAQIEVEPPEEDVDGDEEEDEEDDHEDQFELDIETEIEHQTPEVIAKELLITYLEGNALPYPEAGKNENRYRAIGRSIGEMYNALLDEIRKINR